MFLSKFCSTITIVYLNRCYIHIAFALQKIFASLEIPPKIPAQTIQPGHTILHLWNSETFLTPPVVPPPLGLLQLFEVKSQSCVFWRTSLIILQAIIHIRLRCIITPITSASNLRLRVQLCETIQKAACKLSLRSIPEV